MRKYLEMYFSTRRVNKQPGRYSFHVYDRMDGKFIEIQSSFTTTEIKEDQTFDSKAEAALAARDAIQDHYR